MVQFSSELMLAIITTSGVVAGISAGFTASFIGQINTLRPLLAKMTERYIAELLIPRYSMLIMCFSFSTVALLTATILGIITLCLHLTDPFQQIILVLFTVGLYTLLFPLLIVIRDEVKLSRPFRLKR